MFFRMVYKSGQIFLPFCHNTRVWQTDRQTDRQTEFSSQYRVCITCSAVKTNKTWWCVLYFCIAFNFLFTSYWKMHYWWASILIVLCQCSVLYFLNFLNKAVPVSLWQNKNITVEKLIDYKTYWNDWFLTIYRLVRFIPWERQCIPKSLIKRLG